MRSADYDEKNKRRCELVSEGGMVKEGGGATVAAD